MSRTDRQITVSLMGNTRSLNAALQNAAGRIAQFATTVGGANDAMLQSATRSNQAMQNMAGNVKQATRVYGPMQTQLQKTSRAFSSNAVQAAKFGSRAEHLTGNIKNVRDEMSRAYRPAAAFTSTLQAAGRRTMDLGAHFRAIQNPVGQVAQKMREAGVGLNTFGASAGRFGARIQGFSQAVSRAGAGVSELGATALRTQVPVAAFASTMRRAGAGVSQMATSAQRFHGSMGYVSQSTRMAERGFGALARSSTKISGAFKNADGQASHFTRTMSNFSGSFVQSMAQASQAAKSFEGRIVDFIGFTMLGERVKRMGQTIMGAFAGAVTSFAMFEDSFALVEKTTQATQEQYRQLADEIREVARVTPIAVTELNQVAGVAGQLGVETENIAQFTENMAKMGVATNVTAEQAAIFQARIGAIMQLDYGDDMERMSSTVVDLGNNFAAREDEIFRFTERIAAAGQVVGLTTADLAAFSTAFTAVGVRAERGGTAFQRVIFRMMDAVQEGGEHLRLLAETAGMTANEFAQVFGDEPAEAILRFVEGLDHIGDDANRVMTELFGNNVRTTQSFLALAGAGDLARSSVERGNNAWEQNIALNEEAATRFDTLANRLRTMRNRVNDVAIGMGQTLAPVVETVAGGIVNMIELFTRLPNSVQNFTIAAGILAGMLLIVAGNMALLYYPAMVMRNTIIPGLTRGYIESSKALSRLSHANITAAASYHAHAAGATRLQRAQMMTVAWSQRLGATFATMMTTMGRAAAGAAVMLGKFLLLAAAIWGVVEAGRAIGSALSGVHDSFLDASQAAEDLAINAGITLDAMAGMERTGGISSEFVENNKETIEDLQAMSAEMREISATQIMLEMVLRGADPEEVLGIMTQLEIAVGRDLGVEFDVLITDGALNAPAVAEELTDQLRFMGDEFKNLPFLQSDLRDSIAQTAESLAQVTAAGDPEGLRGWAEAMQEAGRASTHMVNDGERFSGMTREMNAMLDGLQSGFGLTTDEVEAFNNAFAESMRQDFDSDAATIAALEALYDAMVLAGAAGEDLMLIDQALRALGATRPMSGLERNIGGVSDAADDAGESVDELEERIRSMAESASEAVSETASIVSEVLGDSLDDARGAVQDLSEVFGSIDDDTNLSQAFQNAQNDVEEFIDFTRWAQDEGLDDWIIGLVQGGGPEAISQARSMGAERLTELSEGMIEDFLTSRAMTIDAEEAFAEQMLSSDMIVDSISQSMDIAGRELKARNTLAAMGLDEIGMSFIEEAFADVPGGIAKVLEVFESGEGMGELQEMLPDLIRQAKAAADREFDLWPGNFQGKGAAAAAAALTEIGDIEEGMPSEIETLLAIETQGNDEAISLTEAIEKFGEVASEEAQQDLAVAIETGDLERATELIAEVLSGDGGEGTTYTVDIDADHTKAEARIREMSEETWEAFIDLMGGDESDAREALVEMSDGDYEAFVDAAIEQSSFTDVQSRLSELKGNAEIYAEANTTDAVRNIRQNVMDPQWRTTVTAEANTSPGIAAIHSDLTTPSWSTTVTARANTGPAEESLRRLTRMREIIVNIRTIGNTNLINSVTSADGNILQYANGGEAHFAQMAPGGTYRVWSEPETGGEAYIPLAPGKRSRSLNLWERTGHLLGVEGFARGGFVEPGSLTTGIRSTAADSPSSMYSGGKRQHMHRPFWTNPYGELNSLEEMNRLLEQQERQLTLMERQERRRELERDIREARSEHGRGSEEAKDAQRALDQWEEQVRREDIRARIDMIMEEQRAIEEHNRMIAENRKQFHDQRRPDDLHVRVLNERIAAEERFTDRWMQLVSERDQIMEGMRANLQRMLEEESRIKEQLVDLERQYNRDVKRLQEQREESIEQALKQRSDSLNQFFDPMTRREDEWGNTIGAVTDNIMEQINVFSDWTENLQMLRDRGLSEEAIDELGFNDPASAASVAMFVNATDKELEELNRVVSKQLGYVNDQTSKEQKNMYGELGNDLRDIQEQFQDEMDELNSQFVQDQRDLRDELSQIGKDSAMSYTDAIAAGLRSGIPAIREAAREVSQAKTGAEQSGVAPESPNDQAEVAPDGYLIENLFGRDYVDRYVVNIGGKWYAAAGRGQQREALRLWGPPERTYDGLGGIQPERLVDYFGPGVMDRMIPNSPSGYAGQQTFDVGGKLPPGLTMAYNGTGQAEYILRPKNFVADSHAAPPMIVQVDNYVDGKKVSESVTKHQIRDDRKIRVRAGK